MLAHDLREAERALGRQRERDARHDARRTASLALQEGFETASSHRFLPILRRHFRAERQQRHREIAVGRRREEIAADGRHRAHGRPADLARDGVQEGEARDARRSSPS